MFFFLILGVREDGLDDKFACSNCRLTFESTSELFHHYKQCLNQRNDDIEDDVDETAVNLRSANLLGVSKKSQSKNQDFVNNNQASDSEEDSRYGSREGSVEKNDRDNKMQHVLDQVKSNVENNANALLHLAAANQLPPHLLQFLPGLQPNGNLELLAIQNTKAAVSQYAAEHPSATMQDLENVQKHLLLQQRQLVQIHLIQRLSQLQNGRQNSSSPSPGRGSPHSPEEEEPRNDESSPFSSKEPPTIKNLPPTALNPITSTAATSESMLSSVIIPPSSPPETEVNTLDLLQKSTQQVLSRASHGLLANNLVDDFYDKGNGEGGGKSDDPALKHRCRFCGKVFGSDSALQIHIRSHTGERPYKCNICGNRFTTKGNLKVHFQRHASKYPNVPMNPNPIPEHEDKYFPPLMTEEEQQQEKQGISPAISNRIPSFPKSLPLDFMVPHLPPFPSSDRLPINSDKVISSNGIYPKPLDLHSPSKPQDVPENLSKEKSLSPERSPSPMDSNTNDKDIDDEDEDDDDDSDAAIQPNSAAYQDYLREERLNTQERLALQQNRMLRGDDHGSDVDEKNEYNDIDDDSQDQPENLSMKSPRSSESGANTPVSMPLHPFLPPGLANMCPPEGVNIPFSMPLMVRPNFDPSKEPIIYSSMLPRPGSTDNSWENLIEVTKTSETAKLQLLVDNIEHKLSDPNECIICHRVLSCKSALQMHYRTHTGERPFKCKICSRAFTTKGNLKTHMGVHRIKPPMRVLHQCPVCHKRFSNSLVLQQHIRLHTGEPTDLTPEQITAAEIREPVHPLSMFPQFFPPGLPVLGAQVSPLIPNVPPPTSSKASVLHCVERMLHEPNESKEKEDKKDIKDEHKAKFEDKGTSCIGTPTTASPDLRHRPLISPNNLKQEEPISPTKSAEIKERPRTHPIISVKQETQGK